MGFKKNIQFSSSSLAFVVEGKIVSCSVWSKEIYLIRRKIYKFSPLG